jgi:rhodanese-related sulfurtransferase
MHLTLEDLRARVHDQTGIVLDVLPSASFATGHLPRAINIPVAELRHRAPAELPDRSRPIAVYCGGPT